MPLSVPAPASLAAPISVPLKTMTGPGPSNVADRVLQAQALPTLGHLHPEFTKVNNYARDGDEPSQIRDFVFRYLFIIATQIETIYLSIFG